MEGEKVNKYEEKQEKRRERYEELADKAEAEAPEIEPIKGDGWTCFEDRDENRVCFKFDARTSKETYKLLRSSGFVWSRSLSRFQRQNNGAGRMWAEHVRDHLEKEGWK